MPFGRKFGSIEELKRHLAEQRAADPLGLQDELFDLAAEEHSVRRVVLADQFAEEARKASNAAWQIRRESLREARAQGVKVTILARRLGVGVSAIYNGS